MTGNRLYRPEAFASTLQSQRLPRSSSGASKAIETETFFMEDVVMSRKQFSHKMSP